MEYTVDIGEHRVELVLEPPANGADAAWTAIVDGKRHVVHYWPRGRDGATVLIDDHVGRYDFTPVDGERLRVHTGRLEQTVRVLDARARLAEALFGQRGEQAAHGGEVRAVMPGVVRRVLVECGQVICADTPLLIVEAMKMENEVRAEAAGVVAEIAVAPDDTVEAGQLLVRLEAADGA